MGKIRIKTLGSPGEEIKEKQKAKARKEAKQARPVTEQTNLSGTDPKQAKKTAKTPGLKGGEKLVAMGPSEEELAAAPILSPEPEAEKPAAYTKKEQKITRVPKVHGQKYQKAAKLVKINSLYPLSEAIILVKKTSFTSFDGSVEAHINTTEKGLSGSLQLPHGTGKQIKVAIANEMILSEIEAGKINFDILVATPEFMPKLARFAKILGPRGLMPNPKAGTVNAEPEKVSERLKGGEVRFKTETQAPIIHLTLGKVSFPQNYLEENLKAAVTAIGPSRISQLTLSSTMGPGVKVDLTTV
ncbi:MAG: hypothetical protein Q8P89_04870 [bacterium]|nr:hypothetical protein [bacterium]